MTTHITARLTWHNDGWNGCICRNPEANTYCTGTRSYAYQRVLKNRSLEWEIKVQGKFCNQLDRAAACCHSINTFGLEESPAEFDAPGFFSGKSRTRRCMFPPATVGVWPYQVMYEDSSQKRGVGSLDNEQRINNVKQFFGAIEPHKSLIFYYTGYSNPFSENEFHKYVLVGFSRVKSIGELLFYDNNFAKTGSVSSSNQLVWMRGVTSHYPDQGLRLPYHVYLNQPSILTRIGLFAENRRLYGWAVWQFGDDDALGLVESFLPVVQNLLEMGDTTEDWAVRIRWIQDLIAELWHHRGLFPGMPAILQLLSFQEAIPVFKEKALQGQEQDIFNAIFAFVAGKADDLAGVKLDKSRVHQIRRQWALRNQSEQKLIQDILPRFALPVEQIRQILSPRRIQVGIQKDLAYIADNPYALTEMYQGIDRDDTIPWSTIDRGMLPSPELGSHAIATLDDPRRLRALLVETLQREDTHVFTDADTVFAAVNRRLSLLPEWKRFMFHKGYLNVDTTMMVEALQIRQENERDYLYLKQTYLDERLVEEKLRFLLGGTDIQIHIPVTTAIWNDSLFDSECYLAHNASESYRSAIDKQIEVCQRIFIRPLSILAGEAGTGKTTVIRALIRAIKRGHGMGTSVIALAPTGKAADRIREVMEKDQILRGRIEVATLHSFLAKRDWLNPNMTYKPTGGKIEDAYTTYILDECSMLELSLTATFFRAVRWTSVQRLILVGDPNQLPPIGRGRLFSDVIEFVQQQAPESYATLEYNLRQIEGRAAGNVAGIIDLAQCYLYKSNEGPKNEDHTTGIEQMLQQVQAGGDVTPDLRVLYWTDQAHLSQVILEQMTADMAEDLKQRGIPPQPVFFNTWWEAHQKNRNPTYFQILTPYRGEFFGFEEINRICQGHIQGKRPIGVNALDGVMLFDKVIQICNRPQSRPIWARNRATERMEPIEIYNGQIGFVWPHIADREKYRTARFRLEKFCVMFDRRADHLVGYGRGLGRNTSNRPIPSENISENLELAYAVSVHKAQGSEFDRVYVVIPKHKQSLLSTEMFYTALTRARRHCTLLLEQDVTSLLGMRRLEASRLRRINSSLFTFRLVPEALMGLSGWYADGRIHHTLAEVLVRSKSEVIIANMLYEREIPFCYEQPLFAPDGTFYLPDFTINWRGINYHWEHVGMLHRDDYRAHWEKKYAWYEKYFQGRLIVTKEATDLSRQADDVVQQFFT